MLAFIFTYYAQRRHTRNTTNTQTYSAQRSPYPFNNADIHIKFTTNFKATG